MLCIMPPRHLRRRQTQTSLRYRSPGSCSLGCNNLRIDIRCCKPVSLASVRFSLRVGSMGILCDTQIRELIGIEPFEDNTKRPGRISYGVSSYGYDLRVGSVFKIFTNVNSQIVDPKQFSERSF